MNFFNGKILLITGGTGTIGNAVLRRLVHSDIKEIRVFSRDEKKQEDMRSQLPDSRIKYYIGDVRDRDSLDYAMTNVDFVFHAAALKQVSSCENFPMEAFKTNVLGTENLINSAAEHGVSKIVVLGTDKAVYPVSAMGMSKAMMEKIMLAKSRLFDQHSNVVLSGTRFGNVMGSRGSVIPRFIEQIKTGKDIRITDPDMTRFMMSADDAVDLILYTFKHAVNGDIFMRKAPVVKLDVLAQAVLELYRSNVATYVAKVSSGEKRYEMLLNDEEVIKVEEIGEYLRIPRDYQDKGELKQVKSFRSDVLRPLDLNETKKLLLTLDLVKQDIGHQFGN